MRLKLGNILGQFDKAVNQLEKYTAQCDSDLEIENRKMEAAKERMNSVSASKNRASNALGKLREIVG